MLENVAMTEFVNYLVHKHYDSAHVVIVSKWIVIVLCNEMGSSDGILNIVSELCKYKISSENKHLLEPILDSFY